MNAISSKTLDKTTRALARLALVAGLTAITAAAQAGLVGLSSGTPGHLYQINSATGAATMGVAVTGGSTSLVGFEYLGGKFYATDVFGANDLRLGTIDPVTGAFTGLNNQAGSNNWHGLAGNESAQLLYSIDLGGDLYSITPAGVATNIGATTPAIDGRGMAYDDTNGVLYATGGGNLYAVNTSTAAATLLGALGISDGLIGLAYDEDAQILFANAQTAAGGFGLFTLNVSTGVATFVGANGALTADEFGLDGLAWVPNHQRLPEPSALMLVGAALIGLASMRRRRTAHPA